MLVLVDMTSSSLRPRSRGAAIVIAIASLSLATACGRAPIDARPPPAHPPLLPEGGEALRSLCASEPRPRRLCDVLSAALVRPPRTRRQLLELRDISKRVDLLSAELARLIRELQGGTASGPN